MIMEIVFLVSVTPTTSKNNLETVMNLSLQTLQLCFFLLLCLYWLVVIGAPWFETQQRVQAGVTSSPLQIEL